MENIFSSKGYMVHPSNGSFDCLKSYITI